VRTQTACALLAALTMFAGHAARATTPSGTTLPPALVTQLRQIKALTADFQEEKRLAILVTPIVRTGQIAYEAPGRLAQEVKQPSPARLVLDGKMLSMTDGNDRHVIDIDQQPAVGLLVRLLLGVLAGDVQGLARHARIAFTSSKKGKSAPKAASGWTLDLDPTDPLLAKLIKSMSVSGHDAVVDLLTVVDANGDRTVTRFSNVKFLPAFTPQERAARFGIAP
jgi:outer membrane lipoprotein-sorting protein